MNKMEITLKSGVQIVVDAIEITTERRNITGELVGMKWTAPDGWARKLHTVTLDEIAAIVLIEENPGGAL